MEKYKILQVLKENLVVATGCTEPASVALCVSGANSVTTGKLQNIKLVIDSGTYRNASMVIVPGTEKMRGVKLAAALGYFCTEYTMGLNIFSDLKKNLVEKAIKLVLENKVEVVIDTSKNHLFIEGLVCTTHGVGKALIVYKHTNLIYRRFYSNKNLTDSRKTLFTPPQTNNEDNFLKHLLISDIYSFVKNTPANKLTFLKEGAEMNLLMARHSQDNYPGFAGHSMINFLGKQLSNDFIAETQALTCLAVEGRMRGVPLPVMSSWGSGNLGIVATIPVYLLGKRDKKTEQEILRALALSNLVVGKVKSHLGSVSSMCGTSIAGAAGACAGLTYLNDGEGKEIENGIIIIISSMTGVVCDGAKPGCWTKIMVAVGAAAKASLLALHGVHPDSRDGIIDKKLERTLSNLETVEKRGMSNMKNVLAEIIQEKNRVIDSHSNSGKQDKTTRVNINIQP